jgi:hypothetical protein
MLLILFAAGVTWLSVIRTIQDPDPLSIPKQPRIAGIVWANRVFVHEGSLKRWLETRGHSYAVWARKHPHAVAVLRDRPLAAVAAPANKKREEQPVAAAATASQDDVGLTAFALLITGLLGAAALLLVAGRRAVYVVFDRSPGLPHVDVPSLGRRSQEVWQGLARTVPRTVTAARAGAQALGERLGRRWAGGVPSVHRRPSAVPALREGVGVRSSEARPARKRSPEPAGPGVSERLSGWWADVAPAERVRERLGDSSFRERIERLYDSFEDALETLRDYRLRVALWVITAVIAAAGITFLIAQATQP